MITSLVHLSWNPNRVVVSENFDAVPPRIAIERGFDIDIIFVREDGWSLGAPSCFETEAYTLWQNGWVQFARKGDTDWTDISEYSK